MTQTAINVDLKDMTDVKCTCGNDTFAPIYKVKKLSRILSPSGKDEFVQQVEIRCTKCEMSLAELMEAEETGT